MWWWLSVDPLSSRSRVKQHRRSGGLPQHLHILCSARSLGPGQPASQLVVTQLSTSTASVCSTKPGRPARLLQCFSARATRFRSRALPPRCSRLELLTDLDGSLWTTHLPSAHPLTRAHAPPSMAHYLSDAKRWLARVRIRSRSRLGRLTLQSASSSSSLPPLGTRQQQQQQQQQ